MKIAYITPYQGTTLVERRPSIGNLSLAARIKIELIAELLQRSSHKVEILSQGEVVENRFKFYPGYSEPAPFHPNIPVYYSSALPIRYLNGLWSSLSMLHRFKARHRSFGYDLVIIYNLKYPQVSCANYAIQHLGLPVILNYEDDAFSDVWGKTDAGFTSRYYLSAAKRLLGSVSGCIGVSPYLLSQTPPSIPKLLLRGVVSAHIMSMHQQPKSSRKNWVVFSGTHEGAQGIEQLVKAWQMVKLPDWELHIAGKGPITATLEKMAEPTPSIVFHGLLNREENARLLCSAKIGMNPQDVTKIPGNTFPFKVIEYLASALHVISTPRGKAESELEAAISYIPDNAADTIAASLKKIVAERVYERTAEKAALLTYGPAAISESLNKLIGQVIAGKAI
jgi:glycosyltransferase involved in cell wall biosynthesis